jgi:hypothetical protein
MVDKPASPWYYAGATGGITNNTAVVVTPAAVAGQRYFLTNLQFANTSATASEIVIRQTTGSAVLWRGYANATTGNQNWVEFDIPLQSLANDTLEVLMVTTGTATRVSCQGFLDA